MGVPDLAGVKAHGMSEDALMACHRCHHRADHCRPRQPQLTRRADRGRHALRPTSDDGSADRPRRPVIGLLVAQPPVHGTALASGLVDYSNDLLPGGSNRPAAEADVTFAIGDNPAPTTAIWVTGTKWRAGIGPSGTAARWQGSGPVGAMAAAAAVEGLRAAVLGSPIGWTVARTVRVRLDTGDMNPDHRDRIIEVVVDETIGFTT
jgi:hypothetical protein